MSGIRTKSWKVGRTFLKDSFFQLRNTMESPPCKMAFESAPFWIRMFHLPLSCKGKEMGRKLGETVGTVEEVETNEDGIGWGEYLRVKAHVNFSKPLP